MVYFRKEGRALGELTKCVPLLLLLRPLNPPSHRYLVYNLRKRGGDLADKYFISVDRWSEGRTIPSSHARCIALVRY